ncbi:hypothetical protein [Paraburkholderia sp. BL9I2N2]|uniref:hypothetical protein n=1 Tax=Paraburkholderia sp. BL9I2N2 TaxID=1938809 RepID=UPI001FB4E88D|nr:hypothetical protein [Paraburkholderia sp. BL9I2N2]
MARGWTADTQHTGRAFDPSKELLDPFAVPCQLIYGHGALLAIRPTPGMQTHRAIVTEPMLASGSRASRGLDDAIIYELHVGGFTRHPSKLV